VGVASAAALLAASYRPNKKELEPDVESDTPPADAEEA
jgi:hypothetical protein